jgi:hypothetical protein
MFIPQAAADGPWLRSRGDGRLRHWTVAGLDRPVLPRATPVRGFPLAGCRDSARPVRAIAPFQARKAHSADHRKDQSPCHALQCDQFRGDGPDPPSCQLCLRAIYPGRGAACSDSWPPAAGEFFNNATLLSPSYWHCVVPCRVRTLAGFRGRIGRTPPITCPPGAGGSTSKSSMEGQAHWIVRHKSFHRESLRDPSRNQTEAS